MLVQLADDIESKRQDKASATIAQKFRKRDRDSNIVQGQHNHSSEFHVSGADIVGSVNENVNSAVRHGALRSLLNLEASYSAQALPGELSTTPESCNRIFMTDPEASNALQSTDSLGNLTKRERYIFLQGLLLGITWRDENPRHHQTLLPQTVQNAVPGEQVLGAQLEILNGGG